MHKCRASSQRSCFCSHREPASNRPSKQLLWTAESCRVGFRAFPVAHVLAPGVQGDVAVRSHLSKQRWLQRGDELEQLAAARPLPTHPSNTFERPAIAVDTTCSALTAAFSKLLANHGPSSRRCTTATATDSTTGQQAALSQVSTLEVDRLLQQAADMAHMMKPYQASLILYVCAKCQLPSSVQLLTALLQQLQPTQLARLPPAGLVNTFWALAVLQLPPDDMWLQAFYPVSTASDGSGTSNTGQQQEPASNSSGATFNRHQLVQLLWAAARLQLRPPASWLHALLLALQPQLPALSPTELTNVIWGLSRMGFRPGAAWMADWTSASRASLQHCSPDCLACQAASLAVLRLNPTPQWGQALQAATTQQLPHMRPRSIATLLCGLAKTRTCAPPHWVGQVLTWQLHLLTASRDGPRACDVAATVWALPVLLHPTAVSWAGVPRNAAHLKQLAAISLPLLAGCTVPELVQLATGFARLGFYPGAHWLKMHERAVAQHRLPLTDNNRLRLRAALWLLWKDG